MSTVNKETLAKLVADKLEVSNKDGKVVVDTVIETVFEALQTNEKVLLGSLGNLEVVERAGRKGRNPQTGEEIFIEPKKAPKFNPSKNLKDAVK
jgi:DNA-binding protein HU-beta